MEASNYPHSEISKRGYLHFGLFSHNINSTNISLTTLQVARFIIRGASFTSNEPPSTPTLSSISTVISAEDFFLVDGCDGAKSERSYYTEIVKQSPKDTVVLTLAYGKY